MISECRARRREIDQLCVSRRKQLDDSLMFQNFMLNYYKTLQWIKEKTATALDKTYLDFTNLMTKIQRHQTFTSDLKKSGVKRVEDVKKEADNLIQKSNFTEIQEYIRDLDTQWSTLRNACDMKKKFLDEANRYVMFSRLCDDLMKWCEEVKDQLSDDENGRDLSSCKMLLLRQEALARQINSQEAKVKEIEAFITSNPDNFMLSKMKEMCTSVKSLYASLHEPCAIRRENLEEALELFTILHELDDSNAWVSEKSALASGEDLGGSYEETRKLCKRHEQLEQEIQTQVPLIQNVIKRTRQLIDRKHFAHPQLSLKLSDLDER